MKTLRAGVMAAVAVVAAPFPTGADDPKAAPEAVTVTTDFSEAPELKDWAGKARALCETWYPKVEKFLATEGFTPPRKVELVFKKDMDGVAGTSGTKIEISARYVTDHPDDFGMVIHELTHVVQSYPKYEPGWLVEGVADYVRCWRFEPKAPRPKIDTQGKASYRDGYKTAAAFLAWLDDDHEGTIKKLNKALRAGECGEATFKELTGKDLNALWGEFLKAQETVESERTKK